MTKMEKKLAFIFQDDRVHSMNVLHLNVNDLHSAPISIEVLDWQC